MGSWVFIMVMCWNGVCFSGESKQDYPTEVACQSAGSQMTAAAPDIFAEAWAEQHGDAPPPRLMVQGKCLQRPRGS